MPSFHGLTAESHLEFFYGANDAMSATSVGPKATKGVAAPEACVPYSL